jgi:pheromone shutdown protein TraB
LIAEMLAEMTGDFPKLYEIIVKERDAYLGSGHYLWGGGW